MIQNGALIRISKRQLLSRLLILGIDRWVTDDPGVKMTRLVAAKRGKNTAIGSVSSIAEQLLSRAAGRQRRNRFGLATVPRLPVFERVSQALEPLRIGGLRGLENGSQGVRDLGAPGAEWIFDTPL
jgi:hypothetical protein